MTNEGRGVAHLGSPWEAAESGAELTAHDIAAVWSAAVTTGRECRTLVTAMYEVASSTAIMLSITAPSERMCRWRRWVRLRSPWRRDVAGWNLRMNPAAMVGGSALAGLEIPAILGRMGFSPDTTHRDQECTSAERTVSSLRNSASGANSSWTCAR